ncbi:hypothetical protein PNC69_10815 [Enterococcus faecium]|uniref:hypothetical protein n=1 Tax=Enterococcus faecium TaxID=1352 RepID=UPI001E388D3E|nr:hypothetical protein [Enterococcus faecium]MDB7686130.1 hypothetical protein [Enterococcus faecium]
MFWNKKENPFVVRQGFNYPKVLIKTPHKDIEGYIEEVAFFYLNDHDEKFMVRSEREDLVAGRRIGTHFVTSIKEVEANDWYMKIVHYGKTLYETKPNLLEIKLKDTDSVPEVWYRGERVDEMPNGLVDAYIHWHTCEADKPTKLMAILEYVEGTDIDAKRIEVYIDEEGERGSFNLLKDEIDD